MIRLCLVISCICISMLLQAQQADALMQQIYADKSDIYNQSYRPPLIEEVNVRTETRDWFLNKQRYSIRLRPFSPSERSATKSLYEHWLSELKMMQVKQVAQRAEQLHRNYIELYFAQLESSDQEQIALSLQDQITVRSKLVEDDPSKILQLIKLKEQYVQQKLNKHTHLNRTNQLQKAIALNEEGIENIILDTDSYLHIIKQTIAQPAMAQLSPMDKYSLNEIDLEIQSELAEEKRVFDFVELQYTGPHRRPWEERWSVGVSANLPFFNTNKIAIAKLKVEREKEILEAEWKRTQRQQKIDAIVDKLKLQLSEYEQSKELFANFEKEKDKLIQNLSNQLSNPILQIEVQTDKTKNKMAIDQMLKNLLLTYVEYLAETRRYYQPILQIIQAP